MGQPNADVLSTSYSSRNNESDLRSVAIMCCNALPKGWTFCVDLGYVDSKFMGKINIEECGPGKKYFSNGFLVKLQAAGRLEWRLVKGKEVGLEVVLKGVHLSCDDSTILIYKVKP